LVLLAIICEHQCSARRHTVRRGTTRQTTTAGSPGTATTAASQTSTEGWDWDDNYKVPDDQDMHEQQPYDQDMHGQQPYDRNDESQEYRSPRTRKSPDDLGHMNVYFREPSSDGKRKKPKRFRFPVARYERRRFPPFGPLLSFFPWLPIFADRLTKQTIVYSPAGGVYILPPVVNFYGRLYSVAELIASGYASLVSTGAPPPPAIDIAPLVQPGPAVGPGIPTINTATGGFRGAIRTEFRSFARARPVYPKEFEEERFDLQQEDQRGNSRGGYYGS